MKEDQNLNNNINLPKTQESLITSICEEGDEEISLCDIQLRKMVEERNRQELDFKSCANEFKKKKVEMKKKEIEILRKKEEKKILENMKKLNEIKKSEEDKLNLEFETRQKQLQDQHSKKVLSLERKEKELENLQRQNLLTKETQTENDDDYSIEMDHCFDSIIRDDFLLDKVPPCFPSLRSSEVNNQTSFKDNKILENISKIKSDINELYIQKKIKSVPNDPTKEDSNELLKYLPNLKTEVHFPQKDSCNNLQCSKEEIINSESKFGSITETVSVGSVKKSIERWNNILNSKTAKGSLNYNNKLPCLNVEKEKKTSQTPTECDHRLTKEKETDDALFISSANKSKTPLNKQYGKSNNWKCYLDPPFPTSSCYKEQSSMSTLTPIDKSFSNKSTCETKLISPNKTRYIEESKNKSPTNNAMELKISCGCQISTLKILTPKNSSLMLNNLEKITYENANSSKNIIEIGFYKTSDNKSTFVENNDKSSSFNSTKMTQNAGSMVNITYPSKSKNLSNLPILRSPLGINSSNTSFPQPKLFSTRSIIPNSKYDGLSSNVNEIGNKNSNSEFKYTEFVPDMKEELKQELKDFSCQRIFGVVGNDLNSTFIIDDESQYE